MSVNLKFDGLCQGCTCADLELEERYSGIGQTQWLVKCTHRHACAEMQARVEGLVGTIGGDGHDTIKSDSRQMSRVLL